MPVDEHAFTTKKDTWEKFFNTSNYLTPIFEKIFGDKDELEISRRDLFTHARNQDYDLLIISTILWGYPAGMRGNNFTKILNNINLIKQALIDASVNINDWKTHYRKVESIPGLGLSTYTKFLYFLRATVNKHPCVILDIRIIEAINKGKLNGFKNLAGINYSNAPRMYPSFLEEVDNQSRSIGATHDQIEMFIFQMGLNLKPIN